MLPIGKLSLILDGQFGSTGKGLLASYIASRVEVGTWASSLSPNAGHTFYTNDGVKLVTKQLPVGGILQKRSLIYITAGSILEPNGFLDELKAFDVDPSRVVIHPNVAIVTPEDRYAEARLNSSVAKIGSTCSGTGFALARKIMRQGPTIYDTELPSEGLSIASLSAATILGDGEAIAVMETAQGMDLGINSGWWPHCTSREVGVAQALADARVHPKWLGKVMLSLRAYPIRVGNKVEAEGGGYSGDFYPDSKEVGFKELGREEERTTVTGRVRRVASFSFEQLERNLELAEPEIVFLNFMNYVQEYVELVRFGKALRGREVLVGVGPKVSDVVKMRGEDICSMTGLLK